MFNLSHSSVHNGDGERKIIIEKYTSQVEADVKVDEPQYWTVWENKLQTIYYSERITFLCIFCFVTFVAIIGNLLTLYVVITRLVETPLCNRLTLACSSLNGRKNVEICD